MSSFVESTYAGALESDAEVACACGPVRAEASFFRGILIAVPAGLALWVGMVKLAVVLMRHL